MPRPGMDLPRFGSGHLRAILAIKETKDGPQTQRGIQKRCGTHRVDERFAPLPGSRYAVSMRGAQTGFSGSRGWAFDAQQVGEGVFRGSGAGRPQPGLGAGE
jgi:hypothetical protein